MNFTNEGKKVMKRNNLSMSIVCVSVLFAAGNVALAQPSSNVCGSSGGAEICVRFDNLSTPPEAGVDFDFSYTLGVPSVNFILGDNGTTTYEWRAWAWNNSTSKTAQAIYDITGTGAEDYKVTLLQPNGTAGATNVHDIDLDPSSASNYSTLEGGRISGNLTGTVFLQVSTTPAGGGLTLTVDGDVTSAATITAPTINTLLILGDLAGDVNCDNIPSAGTLTVVTDTSGDIAVSDTLDGSIARKSSATCND